MTPTFLDTLDKGDMDALRTIRKSDLHNHALAGGNRALVSEWAGRDIAPVDRPLSSMAACLGRRSIGPALQRPGWSAESI